MGNCHPSSRVAKRNGSSSEIGRTASVAEEFPLRSGAEGLADCGFEYREVSNPYDEEPDLPETRLFHKASGVMITPKNRTTYIPNGPVKERVISCAQQVAQERLQREYNLEWMHLCNVKGDEGETPIYALASADIVANAENAKRDSNEDDENKSVDTDNDSVIHSSEKAKRMLGFAPEHHWRMYLDDPTMA